MKTLREIGRQLTLRAGQADAVQVVPLIVAGCALAGSVAVAGEQQAIFGTAVGAVPWWTILAVIAFPGGLAVGLTMASVIYVRRINRDEGNPPLSAGRVAKYAIGIGCIYGPVCQFGFQGLVNYLTGVPVFWELVWVAPAITGVASMVAYEVLRTWCRDRYPKVYVLLSVKHSRARGHVGDSPDGDVTALDRTDPP